MTMLYGYMNKCLFYDNNMNKWLFNSDIIGKI